MLCGDGVAGSISEKVIRKGWVRVPTPAPNKMKGVYIMRGTPKKFYMIVRDNAPNGHRTTPTERHATEHEAKSEAMRLVRKTGGVFYVLCAISYFEAEEAPIRETVIF